MAFPRPQDRQSFAALFDHTLLRPEATPGDVLKLCDEAVAHGFKGVCLNPWHVGRAARRLDGTPQRPMAVVGFPLGANLTPVKQAEARRAVDDGARELDMVVNLGAFLAGELAAVEDDIGAVIEAARGVPVKVILETGLLEPEAIRGLTRLAASCGAAFVKTSTGFGPRGASVGDVETMKEALGPEATTEIKASGGIKSLDAVWALWEAGATRIGSSASVAILREFEAARGGA